MIRTFGLLLLVAAILVLARADATAVDVAPPPREVKAQTQGADAPRSGGERMPLTNLAPAKPMFDACVYKYRVSTVSPECQQFVNQGLGMYYSYVWMEAARAFETALRYDPECAYAWLMLHRSLDPDKYGRANTTTPVGPFVAIAGGAITGQLPDRVGKNNQEYALEKARALMPKANQREQLLIQSRLQDKGMWPNVTATDRTKKAQQSLDELLMLHDDDEEGWFWRAQLAKTDGPNAVAPFYKALLRVNPLHPGANHEFVHFYENVRRPALGWPYAENYIKSSPGIPHALHMQSHLGMRIGKWGITSDWSAKAVELQMAYHKYQGVAPGDDHQFVHHMDTLTRSLVHDGRFAEAKKTRALAEGHNKYGSRAEWLRMSVSQGDWDESAKLVEAFRKTDKANGAYYAALVALEKRDTEQAGREIDTLRQAQQTKKSDKTIERRLWEAQGRLLCQKGDGEAGLKLLKQLVNATKNDFSHHAWGNGAVYMESWGVGALECGNAVEAEEAFQEALAHDAGSVRGALGMWALCEKLGRTEEADRYLKLARRVWAKADSKDFAALQSTMANRAAKITKPVAAAQE